MKMENLIDSTNNLDFSTLPNYLHPTGCETLFFHNIPCVVGIYAVRRTSLFEINLSGQNVCTLLIHQIWDDMQIWWPLLTKKGCGHKDAPLAQIR